MHARGLPSEAHVRSRASSCPATLLHTAKKKSARATPVTGHFSLSAASSGECKQTYRWLRAGLCNGINLAQVARGCDFIARPLSCRRRSEGRERGGGWEGALPECRFGHPLQRLVTWLDVVCVMAAGSAHSADLPTYYSRLLYSVEELASSPPEDFGWTP